MRLVLFKKSCDLYSKRVGVVGLLLLKCAKSESSQGSRSTKEGRIVYWEM